MPTNVVNIDRYHHGDLRNALVEAAALAVNKGGVESLSLRGLARQLGVSQTAPYRHFASRDDLVAAVAQEGFTRLKQQLSDAPHGTTPDPRGRVIAQGIAYVQFALAYPGHFRVMFGDGIEDPKVRTRLLASGLAAFQELMAGVQALQTAGYIRKGNPMDVAIPAWTMIHGFATLLVNKMIPLGANPDREIEAHVKRMNDIFIEGAAPR